MTPGRRSLFTQRSSDCACAAARDEGYITVTAANAPRITISRAQERMMRPSSFDAARCSVLIVSNARAARKHTAAHTNPKRQRGTRDARWVARPEERRAWWRHGVTRYPTPFVPQGVPPQNKRSRRENDLAPASTDYTNHWLPNGFPRFNAPGTKAARRLLVRRATSGIYYTCLRPPPFSRATLRTRSARYRGPNGTLVRPRPR